MNIRVFESFRLALVFFVKFLVMIKCAHLVVGGGAVGLACARALASKGPTIMVERNAGFDHEISARNSEVLHSGIYYPPNSLKTKLCIKGQRMIYEYLQKNRITFLKCGKWVCALEPEISNLLKIKDGAESLGVKVWLQSRRKCREMEPNVRADLVLVVPETGVFDSHHYMQCLESDFLLRDGIPSYRSNLVGIEKQSDSTFKSTIQSVDGEFQIISDTVINSAGLGADVVAKYSGVECKLYYAKGHYFSTKQKSCSRLVYPIPDSNLASLGLHLTLNLDGTVKFGPDLHYQDTIDYTPNQIDMQAVSAEIKRYLNKVPADLKLDYTGIRPKLAKKGQGFRDFEIENRDGFVNLLGIESPGLTSSLAIGDYVVDLLYR